MGDLARQWPTHRHFAFCIGRGNKSRISGRLPRPLRWRFSGRFLGGELLQEFFAVGHFTDWEQFIELGCRDRPALEALLGEDGHFHTGNGLYSRCDHIPLEIIQSFM